MLIRNIKEHLSRDMFHCVSLCFIRINLIVTYSCFIVHSQSLEIVTYCKSTGFNDIQRSSTIAPVFFVETEKERFVFITFYSCIAGVTLTLSLPNYFFLSVPVPKVQK